MKKWTCLALTATLLLGSVAEGQSWTETQQLALAKPAALEQMGRSVAIDGDAIVVGAYQDGNSNGRSAGSAAVFERHLGGPNAWGRRALILAPAGWLSGQFGGSVAIHGDTIVVGCLVCHVGLGTQPHGVAYVYERNFGGPNAWGHVATLEASDGQDWDWFGVSVAVWGDTAIVGAREADALGTASGAAYVYQRDLGGPNTWGELTKLLPLDGGAGDVFGGYVSIWNDTIAVGAELTSGFRGAVYVFERNLGGPNAWGERAKLEASDGIPGDFLAVPTVWEDKVVAAAPLADRLGTDSGAAYVFERDLGGPNAWGERARILPSDGAFADEFGRSHALRGDTLIVGSRGADPGGAFYVFDRNQGGPDAWGETAKVTSTVPTGGFGWSVALDGHTAVAGDPYYDSPVTPGQGEGIAFAFDGVAAATSYCTAGTSASGCQALLTAYGTPSASKASGFWLESVLVEGDAGGMFLYGANGRQASPWGNGTSFQCVVPPVRAAGVVKGGGTKGACDGFFAQDLNARWCPSCPKPQHNPGAGATVEAQLWYRDPASTSNRTTSLSDALEFALAP